MGSASRRWRRNIWFSAKGRDARSYAFGTRDVEGARWAASGQRVSLRDKNNTVASGDPLPAPRAFYICPMLSVTFLGTSAARPTVERNVSAMALVREGETLLFECGEGTQRQRMRNLVSYDLSGILFTHLRVDHLPIIIRDALNAVQPLRNEP